ncbi:hypothetical protein FDP41_008171 [Naegleria fowleri]|uniref:RNA ligase domain-containing protein n=1 Tax=Naegleria fowleri TaxID=5763 RepID=A0A6A5B7G7_NAEFO|nr:uncharacterized protein FDP41_008171 [Naegleria fowleri]KAF0973467.1 hypothetical protein FDP41_008171 [Naegleria fowleri]
MLSSNHPHHSDDDDENEQPQVVEDENSSFKGYIKIDSSNKNWENLDSKQTKLFKKTKWIITEKVHGANFCFRLSKRRKETSLLEETTLSTLSTTTTTTPTTTITTPPLLNIECAKRKSLLKDSDSFFYFQKVKERLQPVMQQLFQLVEEKFSTSSSSNNNNNNYTSMNNNENNLRHVYIFGELFGGYYPNMPQLPGIEQPIQTGIWYSNDIEFYAFDIAIEFNKPQENTCQPTFVDYETCLEIFSKCNSQLSCQKTQLLLYAEPLFIGSYEDCMEYNIKFESKIPKKLGMPSIKEANNYAEGVVIKPLKEIFISKKGKLERAIIKRKIQEFSEKKYEQAQKWSSSNATSSDPNSNFEFIKYEALSCVTENRLNNAISKIGMINKNDKSQMNQLLNAFVQDVLDELKETNLEGYDQLDTSQLKELNDLIVLECKKTIYGHFKKIMK